MSYSKSQRNDLRMLRTTICFAFFDSEDWVSAYSEAELKFPELCKPISSFASKLSAEKAFLTSSAIALRSKK